MAAAVVGAGYLLGGSGGAPVAQRSVAPLQAPAAAKVLTPADLLLIASTAQGIHMRYQGVTTGPLTADHANDIQLQSFQFGVARQVGPPTGPRTPSPPTGSEITVSHTLDKFSVKLLDLSLRGTAATVTLYFTDFSGAGGTPFDFLKVDLGQVFITSYSTSSGGDLPSEALSLNFATMVFTSHIPAGTNQISTWNFATGTP